MVHSINSLCLCLNPSMLNLGQFNVYGQLGFGLPPIPGMLVQYLNAFLIVIPNIVMKLKYFDIFENICDIWNVICSRLLHGKC